MPARLVSISAAAAALGVSRTHVRNLIARSELGSVRVGHRLMVAVEDLDTFIEANHKRRDLGDG
jgi:excisionase family DNA binding protein